MNNQIIPEKEERETELGKMENIQIYIPSKQPINYSWYLLRLSPRYTGSNLNPFPTFQRNPFVPIPALKDYSRGSTLTWSCSHFRPQRQHPEDRRHRSVHTAMNLKLLHKLKQMVTPRTLFQLRATEQLCILCV